MERLTVTRYFVVVKIETGDPLETAEADYTGHGYASRWEAEQEEKRARREIGISRILNTWIEEREVKLI